MNWENASVAQQIKDQEKENKSFSKLLKESGYNNSIPVLESRAAVLKRQIEDKENQIKSFKVHEQHAEIQEKANKITQSLSSISKENYVLNRQLAGY